MALSKISFGVIVAALLAVHMIIAEEGEDTESRRIRWPGQIGVIIRREQNLSKEHSSHEERQKRSMLPFLPSLGSCNYNSEPGLTCADCTTTRLCLPNNVSITTNCGALLPNCNGGLCSSSPSRSCSQNNQ